MHFLCLYLKIFIHVIHSMLKEYRRKYMCLSPYGGWSWTWITSKTKKPPQKKTFVCQLSLTERLFYPMGHPSRKVATFQLPNCVVQLLSLPVHKNLEKHEMWKYSTVFKITHNKVTGVSGPKLSNTIDQEAQKRKWGRANPQSWPTPRQPIQLKTPWIERSSILPL
jgi:hypothetical protein